MTQIVDMLKAAMEQATSRKVKRVWFEPIGRGAEMQGPSGGWMYEDENGKDTLGGYNAVEAIRFIITTAKLAAYDEYDRAHRKAGGVPPQSHTQTRKTRRKAGK